MKYFYGCRIKEAEMDGACNTQGSDEICMEPKGIHEKKEQASRSRCRWEANTQMYFKGVRVLIRYLLFNTVIKLEPRSNLFRFSPATALLWARASNE